MDLNVRNYDEYLANIQIFKALDEKLVSYESNVDRILYDRCLDLLSEIFNEMKISNIQRVANNCFFKRHNLAQNHFEAFDYRQMDLSDSKITLFKVLDMRIMEIEF